MSQTMKLSAEEIALIEERRAEEQAKQEALLKSYDHYKERTINRETERLRLNEEEAENRKQTYEEIFNKLIHVSNDFKFDCKKIEREHEFSLYEINDNGSEIRYITDENSETLWFDPTETIKLKTYNYDIKISYIGKRPEGHNYYITPVAQYSKYGHRVVGYKMKIHGMGINSYDDRGLLSKPTSVHKKLVDICDNAFKQIEYAIERERSLNQILEQFKIQFADYRFSHHSNEFNILLENDITVTIHGYENGDGSVRFVQSKVSFPYNKFALGSLLGQLKDVKGKE